MKGTFCLSAGKQLSRTALLLCLKVILERADCHRSAFICCNLFDFSEIFPFSVTDCTLPQRPLKVGLITLIKKFFFQLFTDLLDMIVLYSFYCAYSICNMECKMMYQLGRTCLNWNSFGVVFFILSQTWAEFWA